MARREEITQLRSERSASNKDEGLWDVFEIALEMIERGFHFSPVSLEYSQASKFILDLYETNHILAYISQNCNLLK